MVPILFFEFSLLNSYFFYSCEMACSLVVTRVSVAPEILGSTPHRNKYSGISRCCAFSDRRRSRRQRGACGDFVNLEDLPAQSSKMLIGVGFA